MIAEILSIIAVVLGIGIATVLAVIINRREMKLDVKPNSSIFLNLARTDFTNGYSLGVIKDQIKCKNGCSRITFFPIDKREGVGTKRPNPQTVIYHESNLRRIPTGDLSKDREIIIGLSPEVPRGLVKSSLGQFLEKESMLSFLENRFGKRMHETLQVASDLITDDTSLGLTSQQLARLKERLQEIEKILPQALLRQEGHDPDKKI